jgi:hypothetical protein
LWYLPPGIILSVESIFILSRKNSNVSFSIILSYIKRTGPIILSFYTCWNFSSILLLKSLSISNCASWLILSYEQKHFHKKNIKILFKLCLITSSIRIMYCFSSSEGKTTNRFIVLEFQ